MRPNDKTEHGQQGLLGNPETGLYWMRARHYSPELGRFLQPDPIGVAGDINLYAYANNNPLRWYDPWGLDPVWVEGAMGWETSHAEPLKTVPDYVVHYGINVTRSGPEFGYGLIDLSIDIAFGTLLDVLPDEVWGGVPMNLSADTQVPESWTYTTEVSAVPILSYTRLRNANVGGFRIGSQDFTFIRGVGGSFSGITFGIDPGLSEILARRGVDEFSIYRISIDRTKTYYHWHPRE